MDIDAIVRHWLTPHAAEHFRCRDTATLRKLAAVYVASSALGPSPTRYWLGILAREVYV